MRVSRREILGDVPLVLSAAAFRGTAFAQTANAEYVEVKTASGRLRGVRTGNLSTFKGIPYGGSIAGANRFKAAPALKPWDGVRDALAFGVPSLQPGQRRNEPPQAEDCLFLNIWAPAADNRKRPVMFYSHGGGFTTDRPHRAIRTEATSPARSTSLWSPPITAWAWWVTSTWESWAAKSTPPRVIRACWISATA